jgi:hypothetical protein
MKRRRILKLAGGTATVSSISLVSDTAGAVDPDSEGVGRAAEFTIHNNSTEKLKFELRIEREERTLFSKEVPVHGLNHPEATQADSQFSGLLNASLERGPQNQGESSVELRFRARLPDGQSDSAFVSVYEDGTTDYAVLSVHVDPEKQLSVRKEFK